MRLLILAVLLVGGILAQNSENPGTNVADDLLECYNDREITTRDNRLPATLNVLIELIRKIELDQPNTNNRQLALTLIRRFRQDGIIFDPIADNLDGVIPYGPTGRETAKGKLQLTTLTPLRDFTFNNRSINRIERCSLHYMISSTIETRIRGDEDSICDKIARYTSRTKRDAEVFDSKDSTVSSCPVESGVVSTNWGAVKASLLISGIASGLEPSLVQISTTDTRKFDNRYASTIGGEIAEVALYQPNTNNRVIGNIGKYNSTTDPKYFFLDSANSNNLLLTDAEIRGGIDGLLIALNIDKYKDSKVSQILDLYYNRGLTITDKRIQPCDRYNQFNDMSNITEKLQSEVELFSYQLRERLQTTYSPNKELFPVFSQLSVAAFKDYLGKISDLQCPPADEALERTATHIMFFIDGNWPFETIQQLIAYFLDNLDVNKFESSYMILNGQDGTIIVNDTYSIIDGLEYYNRTIYDTTSRGFDYGKVLETIENHFKDRLNNETLAAVSQSTLAVLMPHATPSSNDNNLYSTRRNDVFRNILPDLRIIVAGTGSADSYNSLVTSPTNDIIILQDQYSNMDTSFRDALKDMTQKLKRIPRNVVNPNCKTNQNVNQQDFTVTHYVEPNGIVYSKIAPHYYKDGNNLRIRGEGYGSIEVCYSRTDANPKTNSTGTTCKTVDSNEFVVNIQDFCSGNVVECQSIYLSARGVSSTNRCRETMCRFPDNIKYSLVLEKGGCPSGAEHAFINFVLILTLLCSVLYFSY